MYCGKMADLIEMQFEVAGRMGPGNHVLVSCHGSICPKYGSYFGEMGETQCNVYGEFGTVVWK